MKYQKEVEELYKIEHLNEDLIEQLQELLRKNKIINFIFLFIKIYRQHQLQFD